MMKKILGILVLALMLFVGQLTEAKNPPQRTEWMACTVNDPTGTPLNVRTKPNGKIIKTVKNGTLVAIDDATAGNRWSRISITRGRKSIIGWVLRDYLSCG